MKKVLGNKAAILAFTMPTLLVFTAVIFFPIIKTFTMSFYEWDGLNRPDFISFDNYIRMFKSRDFLTSIKNSIIFSLFITVYQIGLGSVMAVLISNKRLAGNKVFKSSYFIPVVLSITVVSQLWLSIYHTEFGLLNKLFEIIGISYRQSWLSQPGIAILAVAITDAWKGMGYHMIIIYAGLKGIPEHYVEAAAIDGASPIRKFFSVTLPLMAETYKICLMLCLTFGFRVFEQVFIMTRGGPGNATFTMTMMLYKAVFSLQKFGYGCAVAIVIVLQCVIVMLAVNRSIARERLTY
jgi:raffinose/stachyose/melibiose transport system permease protein